MTEQDYLLVCLAEECAEVGHAVAKALRFGLEHHWPGRGVTNRAAVCEELRDVFKVAERLGLKWEGAPGKGDKFDRMMALSRSAGKLEWPCHSRPREKWCDRDGPGGFMGHTCIK